MSAATKIPPHSSATRPERERRQLTLWASSAGTAYGTAHLSRSSEDVWLGGEHYAWLYETRLLSAGEERRLAARMRAGDAHAKERLFESAARWALQLARWYVTGTAPLQDLAQVAWMAVWKALPTFNPDMGRLTTYVALPVQRDVRRAVDEMSSPIHRPVWLVDAERREWRFYDRYEAEYGVEPSDDLVAAALDVPPEWARHIKKSLESRPVVVSLDQSHETQHGHYAYDGESSTLADTLATNDWADDPVEASSRSELSAHVARFAHEAKLTPNQRMVLAMYYGSDRRLAENLAAIGRVMHTSRERVRQIHDGALTRLRQANVKSGGALSRLYAEMD